jgi:thymidylate synthase
MTDREGPPVLFEPLYYAERLQIVNPAGDTGVLTLWTPRRTAQRILRAMPGDLLDPGASRIAVVSNFYGDGMHQMLCNLLYNPQIRHLVAVGNDRNLPTCSQIEAFLTDGLEDTVLLGTRVWRIKGTERVFPVLDGFDPEPLRRRLSFRYLGGFDNDGGGRDLPEYLDALPRHDPEPESGRVVVHLPQPVTEDYRYRPSAVGAHQVVRKRPLDGWVELVTRAVRFGHPVELRSGPRLELLNTVAVITEPEEEPAEVLSRYGFSLEAFRAYQAEMLDPVLPEGLSYTYGNRIRGYVRAGYADGSFWHRASLIRGGRIRDALCQRSGCGPVDALTSVVRTLRQNPESRHAFISLWDTGQDLGDGDHRAGASAPCLVTIFFRRSAGRLTLTATYRAHNLLTAWLQNVYGLMAVQRFVCDRLGTPPGPLTVISHSLGVDPRSPRYEVARNLAGTWNGDEDVDRETGSRHLREDPSGHFVVTVDRSGVEGGEIVAEHRYGGLLVKQYRGRTAAAIESQIIADMAVSLVSHALWLGRELRSKEAQLPRRPAEAGGIPGGAGCAGTQRPGETR